MPKLATRVVELEESSTLAVSAQAARMQASGINVISFGAGEPDFETPPHIARAGIQAIESGRTKYSKPASGNPAVKRAVCEKFARENSLAYQPEQVIVTAGGKMAVYLAVHAVVNPGDEVVIPVPYWVSYPEIVKLAGGVPVFVQGPQERDYKLTPELLHSALTPRTKLFIYNSPSNPSGVTYGPPETRELASVLQDRDVWVLSDEIYDQLVFGGQQALSFAATSPANYSHTITVNAGSKTYSMTGWRVGFAAGPREVIDAMAKLQSQTTSGAATFTQDALAAALTSSQDAAGVMRAEFERRAKYMWERLSSMPGVRCPRPTGAFYCFPDVSATYGRIGVKSSGEFAQRLLTEGQVAVVPGAGFGLDAHVRLSFACDRAHIDEGLDRMEAFLRRTV
ncbi:MAG: pyridoxal phosphate-dependent aminotransferase [Planctomycetota bacterium]